MENMENSEEEDQLPSIPNLDYNQFNAASFVAPAHNVEYAISVSNLVDLADEAFFQQKFLRKVHLQEGLQTIGDEVFQGCGLMEIEIPSSVQKVGQAAFSRCNNLKRAVFVESSSPCELGQGVFAHCEHLQTLELPRTGCTIIPKEFCMECWRLMHVVLPPRLTRIGESAFFYCRDMNYISLPQTLETIESNAFERCMALSTVTFSESSIEPTPSVQLTIGNSAFEYCSRLKNLHLPVTLESLGERALWGCGDLTMLLALPQRLQRLGPQVLEQATGLESIRLPPEIRCIPEGAFYQCEQLKVVKLDAHGQLERIEGGAFGCCDKLSSICIPSTVKTIGRHAFSRCHRLVSVELSDSTAVDPSAFSSCPHLINIKVASSLPLQESCTFEEDLWHPDGLMDCTRMQQIYFGDYLAGQDNGIVATTRHKNMTIAMLHQLKRRWSRFPIHRLCYQQIRSPPEETVHSIQRMQQLVRNPLTTYEFQPFDEFGLSPFHILAMSTNPHYEVFAQLMRLYSVNVLFTKNPWGMRAATCAFFNVHLDYTTAVRHYIRAIVSVRVPQLRCRKWRRAIYQLLEVFCPEVLGHRARHLVRLQRKLSMLEHLESLALLEHAVWKIKLNNAQNSTDESGEKISPRKRMKAESTPEEEEDFRQACRTVSGASVVISRVLPYLEDYRSG